MDRPFKSKLKHRFTVEFPPAFELNSEWVKSIRLPEFIHGETFLNELEVVMYDAYEITPKLLKLKFENENCQLKFSYLDADNKKINTFIFDLSKLLSINLGEFNKEDPNENEIVLIFETTKYTLI